MKGKAVAGLILATILISVVSSGLIVVRVRAQVVWNVPLSGTLAFVVSTLALTGDTIHVAAGYVENLAADLVIAQTDLHIYGGPGILGPLPIINCMGFSIRVTGHAFTIMRMEITNALVGISLGVGTHEHWIYGCSINNCGIGISVGSIGSLIHCNKIGFCGTGIDISGPPLVGGNRIRANTLTQNNMGLLIGGGTANNHIYYNNFMNSPNPNAWDLGPVGPPNTFDDSGTQHLNKGNFWDTMPPPPYIIPGPNGYRDNFPLAAPWTQPSGDLNQDGAVDIFDIVLCAAAFGCSWSTLGYMPISDANSDGTVDVFDLVIVAANFGFVDP